MAGRTSSGLSGGRGAAGGTGFNQQNSRVPGSSGNRFSSPSQSQLGGFLGLPSDGGLGGLNPSSRSRGDNFDVNKGTGEGPRGGNVAGASVTGPKGNTAGKAIGVGPNGGVGKVGGVQGADGGAAARGRAVGPGGRAAAGSAASGPNGGAAARGVVRGPQGAAAGFARVSPSGRYTSAAAVRRGYNHWNVYGGAWYASNPGAWYAAGWATGAVWRTATWNSLGTWMPGYATTPVYYDYGNNVTYEDNNVYVAGEDVGTISEYSEQASQLAQSGAEAEAPADGEWLPLGVFALTKPGKTNSVVTIQLAVNKQGVIRGNYTDTTTDKSRSIQGAVDKETQRVAFTVGDNDSNLIETGLYNLTKDEAPALVHVGDDKTEQWLLVRLSQDDNKEAN